MLDLSNRLLSNAPELTPGETQEMIDVMRLWSALDALFEEFQDGTENMPPAISAVTFFATGKRMHIGLSQIELFDMVTGFCLYAMEKWANQFQAHRISFEDLEKRQMLMDNVREATKALRKPNALKHLSFDVYYFHWDGSYQIYVDKASNGISTDTN